MKNKFRAVMQSSVTPLKDDFSLDLPTFERLLDAPPTQREALCWAARPL
jgi:hypothetical protein